MDNYVDKMIGDREVRTINGVRFWEDDEGRVLRENTPNGFAPEAVTVTAYRSLDEAAKALVDV